ncbi:MAG: hypothetical protein HY791_34815 [Deltaproteobacteria bacterium]|nr:hypothetical protein [Deltaproteobacteria bacterium]
MRHLGFDLSKGETSLSQRPAPLRLLRLRDVRLRVLSPPSQNTVAEKERAAQTLR